MAYGPGSISSPSTAGILIHIIHQHHHPLILTLSLSIPLSIPAIFPTAFAHSLWRSLVAWRASGRGYPGGHHGPFPEAAIPVVHMAEVLVVLQVEVPEVFTVIAFSSRDNIWNRAGPATGSSCYL